MIVWGSASQILNLGTVDSRQCATCERDRPFNLALHYRLFGLYWVFNVVTERKYWLACDVCNRGWELKRPDVEKHGIVSPIPFMHRYGLGVLAILIAVLLGFGWLTS